LGCSPIKAVRELGSERRETVNRTVAVYKSGYMLGSLVDPTLPLGGPYGQRSGWQRDGCRQSAGKTRSPIWNPQRLYAGPSQKWG